MKLCKLYWDINLDLFNQLICPRFFVVVASYVIWEIVLSYFGIGSPKIKYLWVYSLVTTEFSWDYGRCTILRARVKSYLELPVLQ